MRRDRDAGLTPQIVRECQRRLDGIGAIVLSLTARGLTTGGVAAPPDPVYPGIVVDAIHVQVRDGRVTNRRIARRRRAQRHLGDHLVKMYQHVGHVPGHGQRLAQQFLLQGVYPTSPTCGRAVHTGTAESTSTTESSSGLAVLTCS